MAFLLAAFLLSHANASVSFAADSVSVGEMVRDLARQSGTRLDVSTSVAYEPIVAQFEGQRLDDVLTRLAGLIGAEWIEHGGVRTLGRSASFQADAERAERRQIAADLVAILDGRLKRFEEAGPFAAKDAERVTDRARLAEQSRDPSTNAYGALTRDNPITRATMRILRTVDPALLAGMRLRQRIVFSDNPTPTQVRLVPAVRETIAALRADHRLIETASARPEAKRSPSMIYADLPAWGPAASADTYGKTLLTVVRRGVLDYEFTTTLVARDGRRLLRGGGFVPDFTGRTFKMLPTKLERLVVPESGRAFAAICDRLGAAHSTHHKLRMSSGKEVDAFFWVLHAEATKDDAASRLARFLDDPVRYDPIGMLAGPLLRQIADRRKLPLLASLDDDSIRLIGSRVTWEGFMTEDSLLAELTQSHLEPDERTPLAKIDLGPDWMVVRPPYPAFARGRRFDRRGLRELRSTAAREGALSMRAALRYGRIPTLGSLDFIYLTNGREAVDQGEAMMLFTEGLEFVAGLQWPQWDSIDGVTRSFSTLTAPQRELLRRWFYENEGRIARTSARGRAGAPTQASHPLLFEPTEIFPSGIPVSSQVTLSRTDNPIVIARSHQGHRFALPLPSLGLFEGLQLQGDRIPEAKARTLASYLPATVVGYRVTLAIPGMDPANLETAEVHPLPGSRPGARSALPTAYLRDVDEARVAYLKQFEKN